MVQSGCPVPTAKTHIHAHIHTHTHTHKKKKNKTKQKQKKQGHVQSGYLMPTADPLLYGCPSHKFCFDICFLSEL